MRAGLAGRVSEVRVPITFDGAEAAKGRIKVQLLEPRGALRQAFEHEIELKPGENLATVPLDLPDAAAGLSVRLRYEVWTVAPKGAPVVGVVDLWQIAEHAFRLVPTTLPSASSTAAERVHIQAVHPVWGTPREGVDLEVNGPTGLIPARTDREGAAIVEIPLRSGLRSIRIKGSAGDLTMSLNYTIAERTGSLISVFSDKLAYRPGDIVRARALILGVDQKPVEATECRFDLVRARGSLVQSKTVMSSRFGIAAAEFQIASDADQGDYWVAVTEVRTRQSGRKALRVGTGEREQFDLVAKLDRGYFSPQQTVRVEMQRLDLVGRGLSGGRYRMGRLNEGQSLAEGTFDINGKAAVVIKVSDVFRGGVRRSGYQREWLWVEGTDPDSGHTERRELTVHVCDDCAFVSVVWQDGPEAVLQALRPDGSAAAGMALELVNGGRAYAQGVTDRHGFLRLNIGNRVQLTARSEGKERAVFMRPPEDAPLRMRTNQALYKDGEEVRIALASDRWKGPVQMLAFNEGDGKVLLSQFVEMTDGKATLTIPYQAGMGPVVKIQALVAAGRGMSSTRYVVYPRAKAFPLTVKTTKTEQRPNATMTLEIQGPALPLALGVAVVDGRSPEVAEGNSGQITVEQLRDLDPKRIDAGEQLRAEMVLRQYAQRMRSWSPTQNEEPTYSELMGQRALALRRPLEQAWQKGADLPQDLAGLRRVAGSVLDELRDPWEKEFQVGFALEGANRVIHLISGGPDKKLGTNDDLRVKAIEVPWFEPIRRLIQAELDGGGDFPLSVEELERRLAPRGISLSGYRDPFGEAVQIEMTVRRDESWIFVRSAGSDRKWKTPDDLMIGELHGPYFFERAKRIEAALEKAARFPQTEAEFRSALTQAGIDFGAWKDAGGNPLRVGLLTVPRVQLQLQQYRMDQLNEIHAIEVLSGRDRGEVVLATYKRKQEPATVTRGKGRLQGVAWKSWDRLDPGSPLAGAKVLLDDSYSTVTDAAGRYQFDNLPTGIYKLRIDQGEGKSNGVTVHVAAEMVSRFDFKLGPTYRDMHPEGGMSVAHQTLYMGPVPRETFPDTAFWAAEVFSDSKGRAKIEVPLPGNLTQWRVSVLASTLDGRWVETSIPVTTQMPIEIRLEEIPELTVGDSIRWRAPVRLERGGVGRLNVETSVGPGLTLLSPKQSVVEISQGKGLIDLQVKAVSAEKQAPVRVKATMGRLEDAVARTISVEREGRRVVRQWTGNRMKVDVPAGAIAGTIEAKLYVEGSILATLAPKAEPNSYLDGGSIRGAVGVGNANLYFLEVMLQSGIKNEPLEVKARRNLDLVQKKLQGLIEQPNALRNEPEARGLIAGFVQRARTIMTIAPALLKLAENAPALPAWSERSNDGTARTLAEMLLGQLGNAKPESLDGLAERLRGLAVDNRLWRNATIEAAAEWKRDGEYETTALAVTALARHMVSRKQDPSKDVLLGRAVDYLLEGRDEYGQWMSGRTMGETLLALIAVAGPVRSVPFGIPLSVDGVRQKPIQVTSLLEPEVVDLSGWLRAGESTEFKLEPEISRHPARARLVVSWQEKWDGPRMSEGSSLEVVYSSTEGKVGEAILAELRLKLPEKSGVVVVEAGLPPGAEVDRLSLPKGEGVLRSQVEAGKVRFDVYANAEGKAELRFVFRPRFAVDALAKPSRLIGVTVPAVGGVVEPARFRIVE